MSKKSVFVIAAAAGAAVAGTVAARRLRQGGSGDSADPDDQTEGSTDRWRVVTIAAEPEQIAPEGRLPTPLADLDELIEVRFEPAPGDRGTELAARPRAGASHPDDQNDLARMIRRALRESKQLIEAGELATNEPQPEGHRPATPAGLVVDALSRRSPEEGVL